METVTQPDVIENYCIECRKVATPLCAELNHVVGTLGHVSESAPAPQETPAQQERLPCPFCGWKVIEVAGNEWEEDCRATCIGCLARSSCYRTRPEALKAWNTRHRDPAFQKLVEVAETLDRLDWIIGYELTDANMRILDEALDAAREALRLAREGEE